MTTAPETSHPTIDLPTIPETYEAAFAQGSEIALAYPSLPAEMIDLLVNASILFGRKTEQLRSRISQLRDNLDRAERYLDEGYHVNALGEVQGSGLSIDLLCAERQAAAEQVATLRGTLRRLVDKGSRPASDSIWSAV